MTDKTAFNKFTQIAIPSLTIGAQVITSMKFPEWGLIVNLAAQPFWLYSAWKSYKEAGQIGILITSLIMAVVITAGIINYWLL